MISALEGATDTDRFAEAYKQTITLGQKIFKTEWNRIKDDIEKP